MHQGGVKKFTSFRKLSYNCVYNLVGGNFTKQNVEHKKV